MNRPPSAARQLTRGLCLALATLLLVVITSPSAAQNLTAAVEAYERGDYEATLREVRPAAEKGDAVAQAMLGHLYQHGYGVSQDYEESAGWYRLAAQQGNAIAQATLGLFYASGAGVTQDYTAAARWYERAAEQGDSFAQYSLGNMYGDGVGVRQDHVMEVNWLRKAADQGLSDAFVSLSWAYIIAGQYQDAVATANESLSQHNDLTYARSNLSLALAFLGRHEAARQESSIVLLEMPDIAEFWAEAGIIANLRGDFRDSVQSFERALGSGLNWA